jgi:hypothetical protein
MTEQWAGQQSTSQVREWARSLGFRVSARGRLPVALLERWNREHPDRAVRIDNYRKERG